MATCTSRRACADRYSFRLYKEIDGKTEIGKYIWTEYRCPNVSSNGKTCTECAVKLPKHKYQSSPKCDHGFVDGPYPSDSKLYGSPFYNEQIKKGWKAYAVDETRAKEAQLTASSTMPKKTVKPDEGLTNAVTNVVTTNAVINAVTASTTKADKPKQPRKAKVVKNATEVALTPVNIQPSSLVTGPPRFVEAMTSPIRIQDVVIVKVKKIHCEGKDYYFDAISGKAYAVSTNGVGPYKGRYDPEAETINTNYPDSDLE